MKVIKPLQLCLLYKVYKASSSYAFVTTIVSLFSFGSQSRVHTEIELWKLATEELGKDAALDLAMPKPKGEVLLSARFFAPNSNPVLGGTVRFELGGIQKTLNVFGDRFWKRSRTGILEISDPVPMDVMDISYDNAFGGQEFERNPLGKGFKPVVLETGERVHPLPNIEDPGDLVLSPKDKRDPACFGPLDLTWPQRFSKVGTYDKKWLNERFPGFAEDFDPTFFNTAPEDQQMQGFFKGDEEFICENMHAKKPIIR